MAAGKVLQVEGARELRRTLKRAGEDLDDLKGAHREAAKVVEPVAVSKVPRRSGRLAASIRSSGTTAAAIVRAGYASVPYAGPIHWGWAARHIEPQPFIYEAAIETQPKWADAYRDEVQKILDRVRGA